MARKLSSLYGGFIAGKTTPIKFGPNNPAMDTTSAEADAKKKLAAHANKGVKNLPKVDGPKQRTRNKSVAGKKVSGGGRTNGGSL
jgi:hypothetical protein